MIQHSGEIPEVALHSSIYFLTKDADGPRLTLQERELLLLKRAVCERYLIIIRRDLEPKNRDKGLYRGLARCIVNWHRLRNFCLGENIDLEAYRAQTARDLISFVARELADVQSGMRLSSVNCNRDEIVDLAESLGITSSYMPSGWHVLCPISPEQ